jgi:multidrug efflux system outer membrane protein
MKRRLCALLLLAGTAPACANLAPAYRPPSAPVADRFPVAPTETVSAVSEIAWSEFQGDPRLRELTAMALRENRDLRTAALSVERARTQYRITAANRLPTVVGSAGYAVQRQAGTTGDNTDLAVGVSAFEIDLFGRLRNLRAQALETYLAQDETRKAVQISLVAAVATGYATLLADQLRLHIAEETRESQQRSLELTQRTFEIGSASGLDVAQVQTSVEAARAEMSSYRTQEARDWNALDLLVGQAVDRAEVSPPPADDQDPLLVFTASLGLPTETPSQLLQRRPDVLAAERQLRAATVNIGVARAERFPSITLTSQFGASSGELSNLFTAAGRSWSFVPSLTAPLFDAGARAATVQVAKVDLDLALAAYDKTVQVAFQEVADALAQRAEIGELLAARRALVVASERSYRLSDARYRRGIDSYLSTLESQRALYAAQQDLISARLLEATNLIDLYSVLGGGWR